MKKLVVLTGLVVSLFVIGFGCQSWAYKYYGMAEIDYSKGKLLGPTEEEDRPFFDCSPNGERKHPCVVMFTSEFFAMKEELAVTKMQLIRCQRK